MTEVKPLKITETVLRDGPQSLVATRMRVQDMIPVLEKLDNVGYHAIEAWGCGSCGTGCRTHPYRCCCGARIC